MVGLFVSNSYNYFIRGILTIITGAFLLFKPGLTMETVMMVIGIMLLLSGLVNLILSNRNRARGLSGFWSIQGFFNIAVGLAFIAAPSTMVKIFVIFFGIILLIMGIMQLIGASTIRSGPNLWIFFVLGLLTLAGGILLLYNPFKSAETILSFVGALLILYGISEIFMAGKVKQRTQFYQGAPIKDIPHEEV